MQELGRQFRLDLRDDKGTRKEDKEEEVPLDVRETPAGKGNDSSKETTTDKETPENGDHVSAGELLIGQGQKRRTWIAAPLALGLGKEEEEEDR